MTSLRRELMQKLTALGIEERVFPDRTDGCPPLRREARRPRGSGDFSGLLYQGRELAHFHDDHELDLKLGKKLIAQQGLVRAALVHACRRGAHRRAGARQSARRRR